MTTPTVPAGWYEDPYGTDAERYHDGARWTGRTRVPESPEASADQPLFPVAPSRPRPRWQRLLIITPLAALMLLLWMALSPWPWGYVIVGVLSSAVIATAGRRVSYGWWSVFCAFVFAPFGAVAVIDVAWRLAYLPYRDWEMAADHGPNWVRVTHPSARRPLWIRRSALPAE